MLSVIPLGQPILVDHYSATRDRNYRARAWSKMDKAVAEADKAAYYEQRADAAENNTAIYADDPEAIEKLEAKLAGLKAEQDDMKRLNAYFRKHDTCVGYGDLSDETSRKYDALVEHAHIRTLQPFPAYMLSNNNASIRRIKERLDGLRKAREMSTTNVAASIQGEDFCVVYNSEACRVQIIFDDKPDEAIRSLLKANGFRWAPSEKAWQRLLNQNGIRAAQIVAQQLNGG